MDCTVLEANGKVGNDQDIDLDLNDLAQNFDPDQEHANEEILQILQDEAFYETFRNALSISQTRNNSEWRDYLRLLDMERKAYELQQKLNDPNPEAHKRIDEKRKHNEELQRIVNPEGKVFGMVWCGDLNKRRTNSTGAKEDDFTPVQTKNKKKRSAKTAQFSSSPEEDQEQGRKSVRKKRNRSLSEGNDVAARNIYEVLDLEEDSEDQGTDDEVYAPVEADEEVPLVVDEDEGEIVYLDGESPEKQDRGVTLVENPGLEEEPRREVELEPEKPKKTPAPSNKTVLEDSESSTM